MTHRWDLGYIISCILHGIGQYILYLLPLIDPSPEPSSPPDWWYVFCNPFDYWFHRDSRGIPDDVLIRAWIEGSFRMLFYWVDEIARWALAQAKADIRDWIGYAGYGFHRFSDWIGNLWDRVGDGMVWWEQTVLKALDRVYYLIPPEIRIGIASWADLWERIVQRARDWVITTYQLLIAFGVLAWTWVGNTGASLKAWWDQARGTLDSFRQDPYGFIVGRLGQAWNRLTWFDSNALDWVVGLWANGRTTLSDILADPGSWVYNRLTAYLERIW